MTVEVLRDASEGLLGQLNALLAQLRKDSPAAGTLADLQELVLNKNTHIVVAKEGEKITGVAFLLIMPKLGKRIALVEDVVVDEASRGKGIGKEIMKKAIGIAKEQHATYVTLTSRPARAEANAFYQKLGFKQKETNVYRMNL